MFLSDQSCRRLKSACLYLVQTLRLYIDRLNLQRGWVEGGAGVTGTRTFWGTDSEQMESEIWCLQTSMQAVDRSNPEHRSGERLESHQSNDIMLVISNKPDSADSRSHMQPSHMICNLSFKLHASDFCVHSSTASQLLWSLNVLRAQSWGHVYRSGVCNTVRRWSLNQRHALNVYNTQEALTADLHTEHLRLREDPHREKDRRHADTKHGAKPQLAPTVSTDS